jgi:hypothetical protein
MRLRYKDQSANAVYSVCTYKIWAKIRGFWILTQVVHMCSLKSVKQNIVTRTFWNQISSIGRHTEVSSPPPKVIIARENKWPPCSPNFSYRPVLLYCCLILGIWLCKPVHINQTKPRVSCLKCRTQTQWRSMATSITTDMELASQHCFWKAWLSLPSRISFSLLYRLSIKSFPNLLTTEIFFL